MIPADLDHDRVDRPTPDPSAFFTPHSLQEEWCIHSRPEDGIRQLLE